MAPKAKSKANTKAAPRPAAVVAEKSQNVPNYTGNPLGLEDADIFISSIGDADWDKLASLESAPSPAMACVLEATLTFLGDPDADKWSAARDAAADSEGLINELRSLGPFGPTSKMADTAARKLAEAGPLIELKSALLQGAEATRSLAAVAPKSRAGGHGMKGTGATPKAKASQAVPGLPGGVVAFGCALYLETLLTVRSSDKPPAFPKDWTEVKFKDFHGALQQALWHEQHAAIVCRKLWPYQATMKYFERSNAVLVDLKRLQLRHCLSKELTLEAAQMEFTSQLKIAMQNGRRLVLIVGEPSHGLEKWCRDASFAAKLFGGKRPGFDEIAASLAVTVSSDFQVVVLAQASMAKAKELLPKCVPNLDNMAVILFDAVSAPSPETMGNTYTWSQSQRSAFRTLYLPSACATTIDTFKSFDVGGTGWISRQDLACVLKRLHPGFSQVDCDRLFDAVDLDRNGKVDHGEFCAWIFGADQDLQPIKDAATSAKKAAQTDDSANSTAAVAPAAESCDEPGEDLRRLLQGPLPSWQSSPDSVVVNEQHFEFLEMFGEDWRTRWSMGPSTTDLNGKPIRTDLIKMGLTEYPPEQQQKKPCLELTGGAPNSQCTGIWTSFVPLARPTEVEFECIVEGKKDVQNLCIVFTQLPFKNVLQESKVGIYFTVRMGMQLAANGQMALINKDSMPKKHEWSKVKLTIDWEAKEVFGQADTRQSSETRSGMRSPVLTPFYDQACEGVGYIYIFNTDTFATFWLRSLKVKQGDLQKDTSWQSMAEHRAYFLQRQARTDASLASAEERQNEAARMQRERDIDKQQLEEAQKI